MKTQQASQLENLIAWMLGLGITPSFVALTQTEGLTWTKYPMGPPNLVKLALPLMAFYLWRNRARLPGGLLKTMNLGLGVGTLFATYAAFRCGFPAETLREWAAILTGFMAATCIWLLPLSCRKFICRTWMAVVFGGVLLDFVYPQGIKWIFEHLLDPATPTADQIAPGTRILTGLFGVQSLSKVLAWLPWIVLMIESETIDDSKPMRRKLLFGLGVAVSTACILGTTQRGPFVGMICGWLAYALHRGLRGKSRHAVTWTLLGLAMSLVLTPLFVPMKIFNSRMASMLPSQQTEQLTHDAVATRNYRWDMAKFSLRYIRDFPLGNACIPRESFESSFTGVGFLQRAHAHNMYLQQYRERGWIWGTIHLLLWVFALIGAWRTSNPMGAPLTAGLATAMIGGLVDHPWMVINQAMVLATFIVYGLGFYLSERANAADHR